MDTTVISIFTIILYLGASLVQLLRTQGVVKRGRRLSLLLAFAAVCLHSLLLHEWIDIGNGQNLSIFNMLSLSAWLVCVMMLVILMIKRVDVLTLFVYPFTVVTIILVLFFPQEMVINTLAYPHMLFHIVLAILTFSILCVAGLMAVLLFVQDIVLRKNPAARLISRLPPLRSMETFLFQLITLGFILLSVVLVSSLYFYHELLTQHFILMQKTALVAAAWLVFAILLIGRYRWGWRGRKAIYGTLAGVILLLFAYFFSKLVLGLLS